MGKVKEKETIAWIEKAFSKTNIYVTYKCPYCGYQTGGFVTLPIADNELYLECENQNCCQVTKIIGFAETEKEMMDYSSDTQNDKPIVEIQSVLDYWNAITDEFEDEEIEDITCDMRDAHGFDISNLNRTYLESLPENELLKFYAELVYVTCDVVFGGDIETQTSFLLENLQEDPKIVQTLMDF